MGLRQRVGLIFKAKANRVVDSMESPEDALELAYTTQLNALQKVRTGIADVITSQKQLEIQQRQMAANQTKLEDLARRALTQNRDELAAGALTQAELVGSQLSGLDAQIAALADQRDKLQAAGERLQARVAAMRTEKETLKAQYKAAQATVSAGETVTGISKEMDEVELMLARARDKMNRTQARAEAVNELMEGGVMGRLGGSSPESIEAAVQAKETHDSVEIRLLEMKQQLGLAAPKDGDTKGA